MRDQADEAAFVTEPLPANQRPADPLFGRLFGLMRQGLVAGGSEMGLGLTLFSLCTSIRAVTVVEVGRFKGFSTLCLAAGLRFIDDGWDEPAQHKQRPDLDYGTIERPTPRTLLSIDPFPTPEARALIEEAGLSEYVQFLDARSDEVELTGQADLVFIDGDHSYAGCRADVERFVPRHVRPGGYFVLHDYFGWFDAAGRNGSPIKQVADELVAQARYQHLLIDTCYQSFVVFRVPDDDA